MELKGHNFEFGGGQVVENGKSHWPDCINFQMKRHDAWDLVYSLINQLRDEKREDIRYGTCGKLDYNVKDA